ncbi:TonB-dependent receptor plug domain-containing protein [Desulfonema magnum]|uniref:TonB-dependent receptor-like superfamily protein n=1 Tax=Desulfonema magnum TaxID=45655 RepID=A0A975GNB4_9BACT|nr:TonB-dependent receptor [Desulfonema magnum]QTA87600.1 TonB-dependent receptor-like superfamily protein [Desulfonema magnum]
MKLSKERLMIVLLVSFVSMLAEGIVFGDEHAVPEDLTELSIEELMEVEVTLTARKPRKLSHSAAAIFVITAEDIRRSGVTSIPDALRMAPGIQVCRIDSNKWAVTSRGFNSRYAAKLLVLMDGRTIYSPLFSGTFWEVQDTLLEDIKQIEVIRGPGASLWGANAVNGIINIITKSSEKTRGGLAFTGFGTEEQGFGGARYGDTLGEKGDYRIYVKYFDRDEAANANGDGTSDDWRMFRTGFRADQKLAEKNSFTLQGDIYSGKNDNRSVLPSVNPPYAEIYNEQDSRMSGGNILGRWQHIFSGTSDMTLQIYYDYTEKEEFRASWNGDLFDMDFQHHFALGRRQEMMWGLGYRYYQNDIRPSFIVTFDPPERKDHLFSAFIQDDITLVKERLWLTLGARFEHNDSTGFEFQPNVRILWMPYEKNTLWAAISRAVKTPSQVDDDIKFTGQIIPPNTPENQHLLPVAITFTGDRNILSEEIIALELGYRLHVADQLSFDTTAFYNVYDNLIATVPGLPEICLQPQYVSVPYVFTNIMKGEIRGVEIAANWNLSEQWRLKAAYTYFESDLRFKGNGVPEVTPLTKGVPPSHQFSLRSFTDLPWNLECDLWLRYADDIQEGEVDAYTTLDARLGWNPLKNLELSIVGQNLLEPQHPEFIEMFLFSEPTQVERCVYGKITWQF